MGRKKGIKVFEALLLISTLALCGCNGENNTVPSKITVTSQEPDTVETILPSDTVENTDTEENTDVEKNTDMEENSDTEETPSLQELRMKAGQENSYCAVSYIGYTEKTTVQEVQDELTGKFELTDFSFIEDIPAENVVIAGGCDIYCIVPVDTDSVIKVESQSFDENGQSVKGEILYEGGSEPILLVCNVSDIMTNSLVTIEKGEETYEFSPYLSLQDGSIAYETDDNDIYTFQSGVEGTN